MVLRQGVGPESIGRVIWTWGGGVLAAFSLIGAALSISVRAGFVWFLRLSRGRAITKPAVTLDRRVE